MHDLQSRSKWSTEKSSLSVGDVVLVRDKQAPRNSWPIGKIEEVKIIKDGSIRSAYIRLGRGTKRLIHRTVRDLVLLVKSESVATESQGGGMSRK